MSEPAAGEEARAVLTVLAAFPGTAAVVSTTAVRDAALCLAAEALTELANP